MGGPTNEVSAMRRPQRIFWSAAKAELNKLKPVNMQAIGIRMGEMRKPCRVSTRSQLPSVILLQARICHGRSRAPVTAGLAGGDLSGVGEIWVKLLLLKNDLASCGN